MVTGPSPYIHIIDIRIVDIKFISYGPTVPAVMSKRGFQFGQHDQDTSEIYKQVKNNN